jgi:hypothetical protein
MLNIQMHNRIGIQSRMILPVVSYDFGKAFLANPCDRGILQTDC